MKHLLPVAIFLAFAAAALGAEKPNIVYILADDMGTGDVSCYNSNAPVSTPRIDSLAQSGMLFTDAHSPSSVCSPTRYGLLTGQYCWRTRLTSGVIPPHGRALIAADRLTVGGMLQNSGYTTAAIGKWHLGMDWQTTNGQTPAQNGSNVDYTKPILNGPTTRGFDYYYGDDIINWPPFTMIENDHTVGIPSEYVTIDGQNGYRTPGYEQINTLPAVTDKAVQYINDNANQDQPFFLYMPLTAPHSPIVPSAEFQGTTGTKPYGDFIAQIDSTVGKVLDAIKANNIEGDTLIVFASDNGADYGYSFSTSTGYAPDGTALRGQKTDIWEGGHRMPMIVRWDGHVAAGSTSGQTVELIDFFATTADIVDYAYPDNAGEDSYSLLPELTGRQTGSIREASVFHSINGMFAIQKGQWKLILGQGSGGWTGGKDLTAPGQLYDMVNDPGERTNLYNSNPDIVSELSALLVQYQTTGRSAPGYVVSVPEPGTMVLALCGLIGVLAYAWRKRR